MEEHRTFFLEIVDDRSHERRRLQFDRPSVTIGRDRSMDVALDDATISRQSAVIINRDSGTFFQDVGGKNPVRVNGAAVVSHLLREADVIRLGRFELIYRAGDSTDSGSASPDTVLDPRASIENWRQGRTLGEGTSEAEKVLRVLQTFAELIHRLSDRQRLFEAALDPVFELLDVKRSFIGIFGDDHVLEIVADRTAGESGERGRGFSRSIVDRVRRENISILFSDDPHTPARHESRSLVRLKIKSAMCVPLLRGDEIRGVLYLDNRGGARSFGRGDLHFTTILAHFISLAFDRDELYRRIHEENLSLKSRLRHKQQLVGVSAVARDLQTRIRKIAAFDATVLVQGESGTGKELVARAIHERSWRKDGPFVPVNCAAIPENLLESELFGYVPKSGIAGADPEGKQGKFELAHGGTLLLDEVGDMTLPIQSKILRVLEDHCVERLGGREAVPVDIRVVAATNKDLEAEVAAGRFREDLFYRLKVFRITPGPLRERSDDIIPLAQHFLRLHGGGTDVDISPRAREALLGYLWPGNVRELRNVIQNALLMANGKTVYPEDLPEEVAGGEKRRVFGTLAEIESGHLGRVLDGVNWNKRRAAEILGINRSTLYEKIKVYGLTRQEENRTD